MGSELLSCGPEGAAPKESDLGVGLKHDAADV